MGEGRRARVRDSQWGRAKEGRKLGYCGRGVWHLVVSVVEREGEQGVEGRQVVAHGLGVRQLPSHWGDHRKRGRQASVLLCPLLSGMYVRVGPAYGVCTSLSVSARALLMSAMTLRRAGSLPCDTRKYALACSCTPTPHTHPTLADG